MKKLSRVLCGLMAVSAFVSADVKVGVVDLSKIFTEYYKTKEAEETLKERGGTFEKERQEMMGDYQKMVDETQKLRQAAEDKTLSEAARTEKQKAFETKVQDVRNQENKIRSFEQQRGRQIEEQKIRMRQGILDEITKAIQDFGSKEKYNLVLDKTSMSISQSPIVLFSQDLKDVTEDIVKILNASKPAGGSSKK